MELKDFVLLEMLRKKILNEDFTFKNQKLIKGVRNFRFFMNNLDKDAYINKESRKQPFIYTLSDKGFLYACLKTSDHDCPEKYSKLIKGYIHFTVEK